MITAEESKEFFQLIQANMILHPATVIKVAEEKPEWLEAMKSQEKKVKMQSEIRGRCVEDGMDAVTTEVWVWAYTDMFYEEYLKVKKERGQEGGKNKGGKLCH